ncbi:MAG: hydroxymethylglutaryl-CoA reductase, degradative [Bacteroidetes bacterium]|nr:MAG: hydroxymethylglutaryl-CoA reductase, degradative [Bacteroidota bacterium]
MEIISGFSKLSKIDKIKWLASHFQGQEQEILQEFQGFEHTNPQIQRHFDEFSENTLTNYYLPFGLAPNVILNGKTYAVPMVIEESSVVAAASQSAKFWSERGGFHAKMIDTQKIGQVHFLWEGDFNKLYAIFDEIKDVLLNATAEVTKNMITRGGGILDIELLNMTHVEANYYQLKATFNTCDSMGANFINTCLEIFARTLQQWIGENDLFVGKEKDVTIVMSILSNYTPNCLVRAWVECPIADLGNFDGGIDAELFAKKFKMAITIAKNDPHRATTHNKGIFNGVDAVVLATGNDFRAVEACGHTYAARTGHYQSLTDVSIDNGIFKFWIDLPIALGTVGGLTSLHPLAKRSLQILGNPSAEELMMIAVTTGLAQNFGALRSLITTGIQKGHMKMHLLNILNHFQANAQEKETAIEYFKNNVVSFSAVSAMLEGLRDTKLVK